MRFCVVFLLMQLDRVTMRGDVQLSTFIKYYISYLWLEWIGVCF